jgi:small subunit ribosomal protein S15
MPLPSVTKKKVVKEFSRDGGKDTGSPEVQIAVLTARINQVAAHLRDHKLDVHNRRGLVLMVSKRNRLLRYLSRTSPERYQDTIKRLGLRK